jgi:hypothetical protein
MVVSISSSFLESSGFARQTVRKRGRISSRRHEGVTFLVAVDRMRATRQAPGAEAGAEPIAARKSL